MAAHIHRDDVIVPAEVRGKMIKRMRHAADTMQKNQGLPAFVAPIQEMKPEAIHVDESILRSLGENN